MDGREQSVRQRLRLMWHMSCLVINFTQNVLGERMSPYNDQTDSERLGLIASSLAGILYYSKTLSVGGAARCYSMADDTPSLCPW